MPERSVGLSRRDAFAKRAVDLLASAVGLMVLAPLIAAAWAAAYLDTGISGFFRQERVGKDGRIFRVYKLRTMRPVVGLESTVTGHNDPRITRVGAVLRRTRIDELPQLINVLLGDMSLVGPRPDVPGFADALTGDDRVVLSIRPGITGPATLAFKNESELLASQADPEQYNRDVIWPAKVRLNRAYIERYSLWGDFAVILRTLFG